MSSESSSPFNGAVSHSSLEMRQQGWHTSIWKSFMPLRCIMLANDRTDQALSYDQLAEPWTNSIVTIDVKANKSLSSLLDEICRPALQGAAILGMVEARKS